MSCKNNYFINLLQSEINLSTFFLMSLAPPQAYTKETVKEAFAWLNERQSDWSLYVKDIDTAVRFYLKSRSQNKLKTKQSITEELKKLCVDSCEFPKETIPLDTKSPEQERERKSSPPATEDITSSYFSSEEFSLDSRSQNLIEKAKEKLNLTQDDEVLRLLIQIGYQSLQSLLK